MSIGDIILSGMAPFQDVDETGDGVTVRTHCIYPSNATVVVSVRGNSNEYIVMDDGRAFREAVSAGADVGRATRRYERIAEKQGLKLSNGVVKSPAIKPEMIPMAILLVANTSKEIADSIFSTWKSSYKRDFKEAVRSLLKQSFTDLSVREERIVGTSNKAYKFENVIHFGDGRRVIIDPVLRDMNSINSRVVANIDLRSAGHEKLTQRIVYDDDERWSSADLSILNVSGVPVVPFSKTQQVIEGLLRAA